MTRNNLPIYNLNFLRFGVAIIFSLLNKYHSFLTPLCTVITSYISIKYSNRFSAWKYITQKSLKTGSCPFYDSFRASLKHTKSTSISTFAQLTLWHTIKLEIFATNKLLSICSVYGLVNIQMGHLIKNVVKSTQYKKLGPNAFWFTY